MIAQSEATSTPSIGDRFTSCCIGESVERLGDLAQLYPPGYAPPTSLADCIAECGIISPDEAKGVASVCADAAAWAESRGALTSAGITKEDAAAIALYTFDFGPAGKSRNPYRLVNGALFERGTLDLRRVRAVLFRLLCALRRLPRTTAPLLYRGIKERVPIDEKHYRKGNRVTWHTFSSTTTDVEVTKGFLTDHSTGVCAGTLFVIHGEPAWGMDIQPFSLFPAEREILLEPETDFDVLGVLDGPLVIVDLQVVPTPPILSAVIPSSASAAVPAASSPIVGRPGTATSVTADRPDTAATAAVAQSAPVLSGPSTGESSPVRTRPSSETRSPRLNFGSHRLSAPHPIQPVDPQPSHAPSPLASWQPTPSPGQDRQQPAVAAPPVRNNGHDIAVVLNSLRQYIMAADLCLSVCGRLSEMAAVSTENQILIGMQGGIVLVIEAIKQHSADISVCKAACSVLASLCCIPSNCETIVQQGGLPVVVDVLKRHLRDPGVCKGSSEIIRHLTLNLNNCLPIACGGGVGALVASLRWHQDAAIATSVALALANLYAVPEIQSHAKEEAAIPTTLSVLQHLPNNAAVCHACCSLLGNLAANVQNRLIIANSGGVGYIVTALKCHVKDAVVSQWACFALGNLAATAEIKPVIGNAGGIEQLVNALQTHVANVTVVRKAVQPLWMLSTTDAAMQDAIGYFGGLKHLQSALKQHGNDAAICEAVCGTISQLAFNSLNRDVIVREGIVDDVVATLERHADSGPASMQACMVLKNLCIKAETKKLVKKTLGENKALLKRFRATIGL